MGSYLLAISTLARKRRCSTRLTVRGGRLEAPPSPRSSGLRQARAWPWLTSPWRTWRIAGCKSWRRTPCPLSDRGI